MASFKGREYVDSADGIAVLLRQLCRERGSSAEVAVAFTPMPPAAVDIEYIWPNTMVVRLPPPDPMAERAAFLTHRWLCAWIVFVTVRMRYADAHGRCRLWLDDLPEGPGLAFCGNATSHVLIPDPVFLDSLGYLYFRQEAAEQARPWRERDDRVFWRGASTGSRHHLRVASWRELPRCRLCLMTREWARPDLFDVALSAIAQIWDTAELAEIGRSNIVRPGVSQLGFGEYRHCIDIDGNSSSWQGLLTKLVLGSTVLKVDSALGFRQWFYDLLVPWRNFIPVSQDMTDLPELALWLRAHPQEAEAIAQGGQALAQVLNFEAVLDAVAPRVRAALR